MSFFHVAAGVVALGTALSIGVPSATADEEPLTRLVLEDATGDVWQDQESDAETAADMPAADVVGAVVLHGRRNLVVTATFDDLQQVDSQDYGVGLQLPSHRYWNFHVFAGPGGWEGELSSFGKEGGGEGPGRCRTASHAIDYDADTVRIVIPRSCLDRPEWARVSVYNSLYHVVSEREGQGYWDNPHNTGPEGGNTVRLFRAPEPGTDAAAPFRADLTDPTGDVWTDGPGFLPAPDMAAADVERAVLSHRAHRLVVTMELRDLQPGGRQFYVGWVHMRDRTRIAVVTVNPKNPDGFARLLRGSGRKVECRNLAHEVDMEADRVELSIPRSCLGQPRWVRLRLANYLFRRGYDAPEFFVDNPHNGRPFAGRPTPRLSVAAGS